MLLSKSSGSSLLLSGFGSSPSRHHSRRSSTALRKKKNKSRDGVAPPVQAFNLQLQHIALAAEQLALDASSALDGPIELPSELEQPGANSPLQVAGSVVLTGAIFVLLIRSDDDDDDGSFALIPQPDKPLKEQAKQSALAALASQVVEKPPPSFEQTFLGAILAGAIAFVLYQCTATVTGSFASKPLPTDYATRNIAVTVRTIISGMCYLATFVFAADAIGLTLYGIQLLVDPPEATPENQTEEESAPSDDTR